MMVGALEMTGQTDVADVFAALRRIGRGNFIFREDGSIWTFGHTRPTIDTGIRVDINPGPFIERLARYHAFHRANIDAAPVANA
jgi:hypothetical protein